MTENYGILKAFDTDTLETSSIADNYEISSGGIYLPDKTIVTTTNEGRFIADAKNEYLEKRLALGENATKEELNKLLREYLFAYPPCFSSQAHSLARSMYSVQ